MTSTDDAWTDPHRVDPTRPSWRQLDRHLWVGTDGTRSLGTIEQGARFIYIDADGAARQRYRTLEEAQSAATAAIELPELRRPMRRRRRWLQLLVHATVLLAGCALLVVVGFVVESALVVS